MSGDRFDGFPAAGAGTVLPNLFFSRVLPGLPGPDALLAFLWASKVAQQKRDEVRAATIEEIWSEDGARESFERLGSGASALVGGLQACEEVRALVSLTTTGPEGATTHYFINNPVSRRVIGRVVAGELSLPGGALVAASAPRTVSPTVFKLYEEHFGTITPFVGERLLQVSEQYPEEWIEDAVREAALVQARNWRYVERILERWAQEGRIYETPGRNTLEEQKQRYLGGRYGHIARSS